MPGPFPGMDTYLESTENWRDFHSSFVPMLRNQLNQTLPSGFAAYVVERIYVIFPDDQIIPELVVTRQPIPTTPLHGRSNVLERAADASENISYYPNRERELFVEIRRSGSRQGDVVAAIELLSPSNKVIGGHGRREYITKQHELIESETHLLEIDLLRGGAHSVAAPRATVSSKGTWDYLVCLHRVGQRNTFDIWRNRLRQRLPVVSIPLTSDQPDATLDLQEALDITYDGGPYPRVWDYRGEPEPPFSDGDRVWADGLLRSKGFRA